MTRYSTCRYVPTRLGCSGLWCPFRRSWPLNQGIWSQKPPPRFDLVESVEVADFPRYMLVPSSSYHWALVQCHYTQLPPDQMRFLLGKRCLIAEHCCTLAKGGRPGEHTVCCPVSGRYQYPDTWNENSIFEAPFSVLGKRSVSNENWTFQL